MKKLLSILLLIFLLGASSDDARKANEAYKDGNYARAVELYKKAIESDPGNARLYFNMGNALTNAGQVEPAVQVFEQYKSMVDNPELIAKADYNIGNAYVKSREWDKAINHFKKALKYESADTDAKHNYELAQLKKEEQKNQNQQQNQQGRQNQQQQNQQNQQSQQDQNNRQQQQNRENQSEQNRRPQQDQQQSSNRISKEQADKILQALEQKEKELLMQFKKQKTDSNSKTNAKDW